MKIFLEKTIKTNFNQNRNLKTKVKNMKRVILTSSQPVTLVRKDGPRPKPAKLIKGAIFKTRNIGGVSTKREPRLIATFSPQTHTMNWSFGLVGYVMGCLVQAFGSPRHHSGSHNKQQAAWFTPLPHFFACTFLWRVWQSFCSSQFMARAPWRWLSTKQPLSLLDVHDIVRPQT